jgi:protein associated with RNAse G/E
VELLDEEECKQNAQRLSYPPDLKEQVRAACREVEALLVTRTYPFDHERQVELYERIREKLSFE